MCFAPGLSGMPCPEKNSKGFVLRWFTVHSSNGPGLACFRISGDAVWPDTMPLQGLPGIGKRLTARISKPRSRRNPSARIRRIGEKNGSKRHVLAGGNGAPLSLAVSGANRHDSVSLDPLLKARLIEPEQENGVANLCLDAAYAGKEAGVKANGFIPRIRPRGEEKRLIEKDPSFKARRWVVELCHSWFNRFRKLLPRYEKTDLSYLALNSLAAAMIVLNKVKSIGSRPSG